jgi:porin
LALAAVRPAAAAEPLESESLWTRETLLGDVLGPRKGLEQDGVQLQATYIGETLGNVTGGLRRGAVTLGRLEMVLHADLEALLDWTGAVFHVNAYEIHGNGLTASRIGNLLAVSNLEARPSARLFDLWLEQQLFDGRLSLRGGQLAADDEFAVSTNAANFINSAFGWPAFLGLSLPSGGPAYPLATPGFRIRAAPSESISVTAAVFNGDPAGPSLIPPEQANPSGTSFRTSDGAFAIAEASYAVGGHNDAASLPAAYRLGGWYHNGDFADQRVGSDGLSLADPRSNGVPAVRGTNFGVYAIVDQTVWRPDAGSDRGIAVFQRVATGPADRNFVSLNIDGGVTWKGMSAARADDILGLGVSYARIGDRARALDRDFGVFGMPHPVGDFEAVVELTYRAQLAPWLIVQPDLQYVIHPGGRIADPADPSGRRLVRNALVLGLRVAITF